MDDVTKIKKRLSEQEARIRKLEKRNRDLTEAAEAERSRAEIEANRMAEPVQIDSLERDNQGRVIIDPGVPSFEERMADRKEQSEAEVAHYWADATEGLPDGHWRDPTGIIRDRSGNLASVVARETEERDKAERVLAEQVRAQRIRDFPVYSGSADDDLEDDPEDDPEVSEVPEGVSGVPEEAPAGGSRFASLFGRKEASGE